MGAEPFGGLGGCRRPSDVDISDLGKLYEGAAQRDAARQPQPLIKEADPELERLLQEEEEIERRTRRTETKEQVAIARAEGYIAAQQELQGQLAVFVGWLVNESGVDPYIAFRIAKQLVVELS